MTPIKKAFKAVVNDPDILFDIGYSKSRISHLRDDIANDNYPKDKTMREILEKAGYQMVKPEMWEKKK